MSISARRVFLFIAIALVGGTVLALAGFMLGTRAPAPMQTALTANIIETPPESAPAQERPARAPRMIDTPYHIVQPSIGLLQQTRAVTLSVSGSVARAKADETISENMAVILYDAYGFALPDKGRVTQSNEDGMEIALPDYVSAPVRGEIITAQNDMARRLPLDARDSGRLWKAVPYPDGSVVLSAVELPEHYLHSATLFHVSAGLRADDYVLLDPDGELSEGDILTHVIPVTFDAPLADAAQESRKQLETLRIGALVHMLENPPAGTSGPAGALTCAAPDAGNALR